MRRRAITNGAAAALIALLSGSVSWAQATAPASNAGQCSLVPDSRTCIDSTPCKTDSSGASVCLAGVAAPPGGFNLTQTCWKYAYQYACAANATDTCGAYSGNARCSVAGSTCQDLDPTTGKCTEFQYAYRCETAPATTSRRTVCASGLFDSSALKTPVVSNNTFAQAALAQEVARQTQVYSQHGREIFGGVAETCRKGYAGIQNCCRSSPGGRSNAAMANAAFGAGASAVKYLGGKAVDWASGYVYDGMFEGGIFNAAMTESFATGAQTLGTTASTTGVASDFSAGAYGFSLSTGTFEAGQGVLGADTQLMAFDGGGYLAFNPYVFAAYAVLAIYQNLSSCSQEEQMLGMHRGSNLSTYIKTECTSKWLGSCVGYTDTYCSFNSVLARLVNMQGKPQLGLAVEDCKGLTVEQLGLVDFSRIDFTEFLGTVKDRAVEGLPDSAALASGYQGALTGARAGSAQTGTMPTNSNVVGGVSGAPVKTANPVLPVYPGP